MALARCRENENEVRTRPSFVDGDVKVFPDADADDDDAPSTVLPVRRRDALIATFRKEPEGPRITQEVPFLGSTSGDLRMLIGALQPWASCACTNLESSDPALRRRILALHVVHVRRFILALVIKSAAEQAAHLARPSDAAETAAAAQPVALRVTDTLGGAADDATTVAGSAL